MHPTVSFSLLQLMKRSIPAMEIHMPGKIKERGSPLFDRWKNKLPYLISLINCPISLMDILLHWHHTLNIWFSLVNTFFWRLLSMAYIICLRPMGVFMRPCDSSTISISGTKYSSGLVILVCASDWLPFPVFSVGLRDRICLKFHAKLV